MERRRQKSRDNISCLKRPVPLKEKRFLLAKRLSLSYGRPRLLFSCGESQGSELGCRRLCTSTAGLLIKRIRLGNGARIPRVGTIHPSTGLVPPRLAPVLDKETNGPYDIPAAALSRALNCCSIVMLICNKPLRTWRGAETSRTQGCNPLE
ncbi:hypothetical protein VUR80DRAFT_2538 [Thermomyces stellatus]